VTGLLPESAQCIGQLSRLAADWKRYRTGGVVQGWWQREQRERQATFLRAIHKGLGGPRNSQQTARDLASNAQSKAQHSKAHTQELSQSPSRDTTTSRPRTTTSPQQACCTRLSCLLLVFSCRPFLCCTLHTARVPPVPLPFLARNRPDDPVSSGFLPRATRVGGLNSTYLDQTTAPLPSSISTGTLSTSLQPPPASHPLAAGCVSTPFQRTSIQLFFPLLKRFAPPCLPVS
jgi:hypothetical protein